MYWIIYSIYTDVLSLGFKSVDLSYPFVFTLLYLVYIAFLNMKESNNEINLHNLRPPLHYVQYQRWIEKTYIIIL